jgi:hypothetical protein
LSKNPKENFDEKLLNEKRKLWLRSKLSYQMLGKRFKNLKGITLVKGKYDCLTLNKNYPSEAHY